MWASVVHRVLSPLEPFVVPFCSQFLCKNVNFVLVPLALAISTIETYKLYRIVKVDRTIQMEFISESLQLPFTFDDLNLILQAFVFEWAAEFVLNVITNNHEELLFSVLVLLLQVTLAVYRTVRYAVSPLKPEMQEALGVFPKSEHALLGLATAAIPVLACKLLEAHA